MDVFETIETQQNGMGTTESRPQPKRKGGSQKKAKRVESPRLTGREVQQMLASIIDMDSATMDDIQDRLALTDRLYLTRKGALVCVAIDPDALG